MCRYSLKYIETAKINLQTIGGLVLSSYQNINFLSPTQFNFLIKIKKNYRYFNNLKNLLVTEV